VILLGLTGSIGMGKSTTAAMFAAEGAPVYDADAAVHELYAAGGAAVAPVKAAFPGVSEAGAIQRGRLSARVLNDPEALRRLETIVHPLVGAHRQAFFEQAAQANAKILVLDVPLLFETGGDARVDEVLVVSAPRAIQVARVRQRRRMADSEIARIIGLQMPDAEKRRRADVVIRTGLSRHYAMRIIRRWLKAREESTSFLKKRSKKLLVL
jgi:dephospho-CoA kinase